MIVFISGPYNGKEGDSIEENVRLADEYSRRFAKLGVIPVCPHKNTLDWEKNPEFSNLDHLMAFHLATILHCHAVFMMPQWETSKGACIEEYFTRLVQKPLFYSEQVFKDWFSKVKGRTG